MNLCWGLSEERICFAESSYEMQQWNDSSDIISGVWGRVNWFQRWKHQFRENTQRESKTLNVLTTFRSEIYSSIGRNLELEWYAGNPDCIWIKVAHNKCGSEMFIMTVAQLNLFIYLGEESKSWVESGFVISNVFMAVIQKKYFQKVEKHCKGPEKSIIKYNCFNWEMWGRGLGCWWSKRFKHCHYENDAHPRETVREGK